MRILVTGGGGFLGGGIARKLRGNGHHVIIAARQEYPELAKLGIVSVQADIRDTIALERVTRGVDAVIHTAAKAGVWGNPAEFRSINVIGTENVIEACRKNKIAKLVYTSSPSVVFGKKPVSGADESIPYPSNADYLCEYAKTKASAEKLVLSANSPELATISLRPHLIWGPGDPHLLPRLIDRANKRKLKIVGDGKNIVDLTYIDNAVKAHLLALDKLESGSPCAGKAYFVTDGSPVKLWEWINRFLAELDIPEIKSSVTFSAAWNAGWLMEKSYGLFGVKSEPIMTRFVAAQLAHDHYFSIGSIKRDLGYHPASEPALALKLTAEYFRRQAHR